MTSAEKPVLPMVNTHPTHAWFTGFAPYEDPQVVITVFVEEGGEGRYRRAYRSRNFAMVV